MQFGDVLTRGDVAILFVKIWRGIERVGSAVNVRHAVNGIGAGGGAQVEVRATGGALLRIVHRGIDAKLLNGFRRRRGQSLANGQIRRGGALNFFGGGAAGAGDAGIVHNAGGSNGTRTLAVE